MGFQPFATRLADHRAVLIPSELGAEERERFIARIESAVKQQAESARKCDAILRVQPEVQVEQDRILIAHEPAAVADPEIIQSSDERPGIDTLWWLTASLVRALRGFVDDNAPHGGIQPGALYLDATGRVKLGDFGIARVFESVCGLDNRRYLACDTTANESGGVGLSGCWGLLNEDESRDYGWIAPYFAHELLDGRVRLNFKSDQFALGVLLFLLATGSHPYGAALSDPTLLFYFHLEPYALDDERAEWEEIFERESKGVAGSADKPVLAWSELVRRMCASETSERCSSPAEAEKQVKPHIQPAWEDASSAIARALEWLENGKADAALERVSPWVDNEALSDIWRERLSAWVKRVEDEKEVIVRRHVLKRRLNEGQAALNDQDLERARAIAKEAAEDEDADDVLMREVDRLLRECDEHEKFVRAGAEELANQYLESGREALARGELKEARENFEAVLKDPAMPPARVEQAKLLLLEIETVDQRGKQQLAALNEAIVEYREGRYAEARKRLEAVLAGESLPESVAAQARLLLEEVSETGDRVAEFTQALDDARAAWERADLAALADSLGSVPQDFVDPNITTRRGELVEAYDTVRMAVEHKRNAERLLEADDAAAALRESRHAAAIERLPPALLEELAALTGRCEQEVREQQAAILANTGAMLDKAELCLEEGDAKECRKLVDAVLQTEGLSSEIITRASTLLDELADILAKKENERIEELFRKTREAIRTANTDAAHRLLTELSRIGLGLSDDLKGQVRRLADEFRANLQPERSRVAARRELNLVDIERRERDYERALRRLSLLMEHCELSQYAGKAARIIFVRILEEVKDEGFRALDRCDIAAARKCEKTIIDFANSNPTALRQARRLLAACDKQERLTGTREDLAMLREIERAEVLLERDDLESCTEILEAVKRDPRASHLRYHEACSILGEVRERRRSTLEQNALINEVEDHLQSGNLAEAQRILDRLGRETLYGYSRERVQRLQDEIERKKVAIEFQPDDSHTPRPSVEIPPIESGMPDMNTTEPGAHYDVFLCYNSTDKTTVIEIGKQLKKRGLRPWLDIWAIRPGASWPDELQEQISTIGSAAVFVGPNGIGPWHHRELLGFISQFVARRCRVIPVILPGCDATPTLPPFLKELAWVDFRISSPDPLEQLVFGITGQRGASHEG